MLPNPAFVNNNLGAGIQRFCKRSEHDESRDLLYVALI